MYVCDERSDGRERWMGGTVGDKLASFGTSGGAS